MDGEEIRKTVEINLGGNAKMVFTAHIKVFMEFEQKGVVSVFTVCKYYQISAVCG